MKARSIIGLVIAIALCECVAFGGDIQDAAKAGDLEKVEAVLKKKSRFG